VPRGRSLNRALLQVYQRVDEAIGRLVEAAPPGTHVAVLSGMGLRPNTNGLTLLPRALEALGYTVPAVPSAAARRRERLRKLALTAVPRPLARAVRRRMLDPAAVDRHMERIWTESTDWSRTRAWAEAEQGSGFIRLNVAGRDPGGMVRRGRQYDELCAEIAADLLELREVESGLPAIDEVVHRSELTSGPYEDALPDLLVKWSDRAVVRRAHHPRVGIVEDDGSNWQVTEHDSDGWLVLSGPLARTGARTVQARVEDVAPTIVHLMGGIVPRHVDGRVLTELLEPETGRVRREADDRGDEVRAAV
jgi:predicted AlkP superfamily phosphohydrolase/phosphomutase